MSDGGAAVIVKAGEGVIELAKFPAGRAILWFVSAWLAISGLSNWSTSSFFFFIAVGLAVVALVAGWLAGRRKRAERAALRQFFLLIGFTLMALIGAIVLVARRKKEPDVPVPTNEEVEALLR